MTICITRVYTRTGDRGTTALVGGKRVPKDSPRIATYGTIDELNAVLGLARVFNEERLAEGRSTAGVFRRLQNRLFDLGSELATPDNAVYEGMFRIGDAEVKELEPLRSFVEQRDPRALSCRTDRGRGVPLREPVE